MSKDINITHANQLAKNWGYLTNPEISALSRIVKMLPDNPLIVNLGAGAGTSGFTIFASRNDITMYTVDINQESPLGCLDAEKNACAGFGIAWPVPNWHQILGKSHEIAKEWLKTKPKLDMIFIDDGHDLEDITGDIDFWMPNMKKGGIMSFHDYNGETWPVVTMVIDQKMDASQTIIKADSFIAFWV